MMTVAIDGGNDGFPTFSANRGGSTSIGPTSGPPTLSDPAQASTLDP
jgi:hypothetical protein